MVYGDSHIALGSMFLKEVLEMGRTPLTGEVGRVL